MNLFAMLIRCVCWHKHCTAAASKTVNPMSKALEWDKSIMTRILRNGHPLERCVDANAECGQA